MQDEERRMELLLTGERFSQGKLPLDFLQDLTKLGEAIREAAKESYLSHNPNRRRIPKGFAESVRPSITSVTAESALLTIETPETPRTDSQTMLIPRPDYVKEAWDKIIDELSGTAQGDKTSSSRNGTGAVWRDKLRSFGANLKDGETATLISSGGRKAVYGREGRHYYLHGQFPSQPYTEQTSVTGKIHAVDSHAHTFQMTLTDGAVIIAETPEEYRTEVREAWSAQDQGSHAEALIQGEVEFNEKDQPTKIRRITEITLLHPLDIDRQIEDLLKLERGWLDGEGEKPGEAGLHWLRDALQSCIMFSDETMPYLYPTEDGGVQAEWTIGNISADLSVNLDSRQATWGWSNLSGEDEGERNLDLNKEPDWQWLNNALREIAESSAA